MKKISGQRWKCSNPVCLVEIQTNSNDSSAKIKILQSDNTKDYPIDTIRTLYGFPQNGDDHNIIWEYLHGQDKPI